MLLKSKALWFQFRGMLHEDRIEMQCPTLGSLQPLEDDFEAIAHQVLCLQKMEIFHNVW